MKSLSSWKKFTSKALYDSKRRAKKHGVAHDLTLGTLRLITPIWDHFKCDNCKCEMKGRGKMAGNSPTVDRIFPDKGYTVGNVQVICNDCNIAKGNVKSPEELEARIVKMQTMLLTLKEMRL